MAETPEQALEHVAHAVNYVDEGELVDYLAFKAKDEWGSPLGLNELKIRSAKRKVSVGGVSAKLRTILKNGQKWDYYTGTLMAGYSAFAEAKLVCVGEDISGEGKTTASTVMVTYCFVYELKLI